MQKLLKTGRYNELQSFLQRKNRWIGPYTFDLEKTAKQFEVDLIKRGMTDVIIEKEVK